MENRDDIDIAIFDIETRTTLKKEDAMISNTNHGQRKASNKVLQQLLNSMRQNASILIH